MPRVWSAATKAVNAMRTKRAIAWVFILQGLKQNNRARAPASMGIGARAEPMTNHLAPRHQVSISARRAAPFDRARHGTAQLACRPLPAYSLSYLVQTRSPNHIKCFEEIHSRGQVSLVYGLISRASYRERHTRNTTTRKHRFPLATFRSARATRPKNTQPAPIEMDCVHQYRREPAWAFFACADAWTSFTRPPGAVDSRNERQEYTNTICCIPVAIQGECCRLGILVGLSERAASILVRTFVCPSPSSTT